MREYFDLRSLVLGVLRTIDPSAEIKDIGLLFHNDNDDPVNIYGDRIAIREAITCLLDNAIEYAPPLTDIEIVVEKVGESVNVVVLDRGPGFEHEHSKKPELGSKNSSSPHVGLGLAIVEKVATSHGGDLKVSKREGGGSRCDLCFMAL